MSDSTETVLEKCPLEAALVASLKLIIYMLDFCALSVGAITKIRPRTLWFCPKGFLNSALSYMSGGHNIWCNALNGALSCPWSFLSRLSNSLYNTSFYQQWKNLLNITDTLYKTHSEYN